MPRAGFEPVIPATKWPQTYALDRATTEIGGFTYRIRLFCGHALFCRKAKFCGMHTRAIVKDMCAVGKNKLQNTELNSQLTVFLTASSFNTLVVWHNSEESKYVSTFSVSLVLQTDNQLLVYSRCQWPHGLRRRSGAAWLLGSWVRISLEAWMLISCVYMLCCPV
jgi:hypothetical protein